MQWRECDYRYFDVAKATSYLSVMNCARIGAILVLHKDIITSGYNLLKSHPLQKKLNKYRFEEYEARDKEGVRIGLDRCKNYMHAEMNCLIKAKDYDLRDASMYIYREYLDGKLAMCRPCASCMKEIIHRGIRKIYYTSDVGYCMEKIL